MIELLSTLSFSQLLILVIMLMLAAKECWTLIDFFKKKISERFNKGQAQADEKRELSEQLEKISKQIEQHQVEYEKIKNTMLEIRAEYNDMFEKQEKILSTLIASDIEDIKSYIVKQYHFFIAQGWIDDFSMDVLEKRFAHYVEEGGNSYVHTLMEKLRQLPNHPPTVNSNNY